MIVACFLFICLLLETVEAFSIAAIPFYSRDSDVGVSHMPASVFGIASIFHVSHSGRCVVISHCGLNLCFLTR